MSTAEEQATQPVSPEGGPGDAKDAVEAGRPRILVVDDERAILRAMRKVFNTNSYDVTTLEDPLGAIELLRESDFDVVLSDLRMPRMSGIELLEQAKALQPDAELIMMTAFATVETALEAVKAGAFDYLTKPFENIDHVIHVVEKALEKRRLVTRTRDLERTLASTSGFSTIIGSAPQMREVYQLIDSVAPTSANVLIRGETGTGKELVARAIHERSGRSHEKLVTVNCSALTETLLESELFGHKKGSFTGALADKKGLFEGAHRGTLFLDELGDMSLSTQVKLLRVLQEGEVRPIGSNDTIRVDVRVVAATHVDLETAMQEGRFREDLYWRLNVIRIDLPPLRDRTGDIPMLAHFFLQRAAKQFSRDTGSISPDALDALCNHSWDGNVRELENVLERAVVLCRTNIVEAGDLPERVTGASGLPRPAPRSGETTGEIGPLLQMGFKDAKEIAVNSFERRYVEGLLAESKGNISDAARRAGLDRSNFRRVLTKHGVDADAFRD